MGKTKVTKTFEGRKHQLSLRQVDLLGVLDGGFLYKKTILDLGNKREIGWALQRLEGLEIQGLAEQTFKGWKITPKGRRLLKAIEAD